MKILLIALEFPPLNTAGSVRPFRMAEELVRNGMDVTVLTMSKNEHHGLFSKPNNLNLDSSALKVIEIDPSHPEKAKRNKIHAWFSTGDYYLDVWGSDVIEWIQHEIERNGRPDWIMGTCPPFSTAKLLLKIKAQFGLPYILDLRDAWSQWNVNPLTSYFHYLAKIRDERRCISAAAITLTTSEQTRQDLIKLHGQEMEICCVENGYDVPIQFPERLQWKSPDSDAITIGYVGSFYYEPSAHERMHSKWYQRLPHRWFHYTPRREDWTYRSPYYFFQVLQGVFNLEPSWRKNITIEFVGKAPGWLTQMIELFDFEDIVTSHGQVSLSRSLEIQNSFDFFLGTSAKIEGQPDYSMGSKYFEALQFLKPILAFCGASPLKDLVEKSNLGIVLEPDLTATSSRQLISFLRQKSVKIDADFLQSKSRVQQVDKLLNALKVKSV